MGNTTSSAVSNCAAKAGPPNSGGSLGFLRLKRQPRRSSSRPQLSIVPLYCNSAGGIRWVNRNHRSRQMRPYGKRVIRKPGFFWGKINAHLQAILFPARKEIKCVFKGGGHIMGFYKLAWECLPVTTQPALPLSGSSTEPRGAGGQLGI